MYHPGYPTFRLFLPEQAVGANLVYFDLFNATDSGLELDVLSVVPIISGDVAVVGTLGVDLFLTRTTAVGKGGTAATREGTALDAATFANMTRGEVLSGDITARLTPTGGATAGAVISEVSVFTEETNAAPYWAHTNDFVRRGLSHYPPVVVRAGSGLRVVQGAVASVGNIGFDVIFQARKK